MSFIPTSLSNFWYGSLGRVRSGNSTPIGVNPYNGGSAYNYSFPEIDNWDCGSALTGKFPVGKIDGENA